LTFEKLRRTCASTNRGPEIIKVVAIAWESTRQPRDSNGVIVMSLRMISVRFQHIRQQVYQARRLDPMIARNEETKSMTMHNNAISSLYIIHIANTTPTIRYEIPLKALDYSLGKVITFNLSRVRAGRMAPKVKAQEQ
jgi:hypothetical protein